jgi:ankyrin repeat protein
MVQVQRNERPSCDASQSELAAAASRGHDDMVLALLDAGVDVNQARTDDGATPLYTASQNGHQSLVESLLAVDDIDVNKARTDDGSTPLFAVNLLQMSAVHVHC